MPSRAERERTQQRRALADAPEGMTEALMMAHGFNSELRVDLCIVGLAIAKVERISESVFWPRMSTVPLAISILPHVGKKSRSHVREIMVLYVL